MSNVISFNEFKSKRNRLEDIQIARDYIFNILDEDSIEFKLIGILLNDAYNQNNLSIPMNYSKASRELKVSENKIRHAYKNVLEHKVMIELFKKPHRQTIISVKNLIIATDYQEEFKGIL